MPSRAPGAASPKAKAAPRIGLLSLGCAKALVDSEQILTRLRAEGYHLSDTYQGADVVVVNTCGFLNSARNESLQAIGEALAENGRVIVTGCLGGDEAAIRAQHPEVLAVTGPHQFEAVLEAVHQAAPPPALSHGNLLPPQGVKLTPSHYAYLKISEGCDHHCSFCIIPSLRGRLASRPAAEILDEAERLAIAGVQELLIISQDTAAYGRDIGHASSLWQGREIPAHIVDLLEALAQFGLWLRLHYVYPYPLVDRLIPLMAEGKVLPYLDVPFQHASPAVLRAMRRPAAQEKVLERIANWRQQVPDLTLRSTFIVGFPGETEEDFRQLLDWLEAAQLDRVGCFKYEPVAGAAANQLADPVDEALKEDRWHRLMATQRAISARRLARKIGQTLEVLVDEVDEDGAFARSSADSPEVDGCVFLNGETHVAPGDRIEVKIDHADDYDLWGHRVDA